MIEEIKNKLRNVDYEDIKLFFITRKKLKEKIEYNVLNTNTTENVRKELLNIASDKLISLISKNHLRYTEYDPVSQPNNNTIQKVNTDELKNFKDIKNQFDRIDLEFFSLTESKNVWAYVLYINNPTIIFFKKYFPAQNLRKKGIMALFYRDGLFNDLNDNVLAIHKEFDCVFYEGYIYIVNKKNFEKIFSYLEEWVDNVEKDLEKLEKKKLIGNIDEFWEYCKTDRRKVKKLHQVLQGDFQKTLDSKIIRKINSDFNLSLKFNSQGDLIVRRKDIWKVLRILDDDHLNSPYSHYKYISHSKERKKA